MKRTRILKLAAAALAVLFAAFSGACSLFGGHEGNNQPISIPTAEPTAEPTELDPTVIDAFIGDWYGVYSVTEARGVYAPNAHVSNDCAMRVSIDSFGAGSCFLQVNGMGRDAVSGSSNVFALCTANVVGSSLELNGMINRTPIEWSFDLENSKLSLTEVYGDVDNYMRVEISLVRPDAFAFSDVVPEALDFLLENGFVGVVDRLGGSSAELPAINAPAGVDPHVFFTSDGAVPSESPAADDSVMSADGHIRVTLPEGYTVTENTVMDFAVACPEQGVRSIDFTVSAWNTSSLSFLLGNTPNVSELYHYEISGFDFYGTFIASDSETDQSGSASVFKLCGTNDSGMLIIITLTLDMDPYSAYRYINVENDAFTELILRAEFFSF
ncbi:MAG: hypothetical protein IKG85_08585 [Clostridia bacterium]|nr:hypothetical protein [Clostridia bacterium]